MKLLFMSFGPIAMDVAMPDRAPLGGSESAMAYLARQMARNGHDVTFSAYLPAGTPERVQGVRHVPLESQQALFGQGDYDAIITLTAPLVAQSLARAAPGAVQVAWLHHMPDQPAMEPLAAMAPFIDYAVFVSQSQRAAVPFAGRSHVIGNGIAPSFEAMFASAEELRAAKQNSAAYTSTPYRGLKYLPEVIGRMQQETSFEIFSGMRIPGTPEHDYAAIYARLRAAPRTRLHGAVAQPLLAQELKRIAFLAYPSLFMETYCIVALEAIAAGLKVVSTDWGALKETTLGFAELIPVRRGMRDDEIITLYTAALERQVAEYRDDPDSWAAQRFEQSQAVNRICSWRARAREWEAFLEPAVAARRGGA